MRWAAVAAVTSCVLGMTSQSAMAQADAPRDEGTFTLGQIIVTGQKENAPTIGSTVLDREAMFTFNRVTLDDAVQLIPGVTSANSGGSRNERLIFVRGFDRFQVPLSIDGIRVYLPADNRLDYGRFLTPDIAQVQVAKGYASVLDGPGAMGGAINLVTRKPVKAIEAEAQANLTLDRDGDYGGYTLFGLLGTRQDKWYAQGSYARTVQDHWDLPGRYRPRPGSSENGGERDFSATRDWRVNAKIGFTPNATDEYAFSYTRQEGVKNAPLHITDPVATQRNWQWPYWNIESLYFLSTTALGDRAALKTRVYRNRFSNLLRAFDNRSQTTQTLARAFNSYYQDRAWGGSAELRVDLSAANRFTLAGHYRRDVHGEYQQSFGAAAGTEPLQRTAEETYSLAAENQMTVAPGLTVTSGISYDWRDLKDAQDYTGVLGRDGRFVLYPLRDARAWNGQGKIVWSPEAGSELHASISSRARFPTIFERFSTQFGAAASNPDLRAERATHYEIGGMRTLGAMRLEGALFYSNISNAIVAVRPTGFPANVTQRRNLGSAEYWGGEIAASVAWGAHVTAGGNYTYTRRSFDVGAAQGVTVPVFRLTDVPTHKGFAYLDWSPFAALHVVPSVEAASNRTTVTTAAPPVYYRTGGYVSAGVRIAYTLRNGVDMAVGVRNLFDDYYVLTDGFPEQGRTMFASLRARY